MENNPKLVVEDIIIEFLEVAIHQLICLRRIYPDSIFILRKKYGVPVKVSQHPGLNRYITDILRTVHKLLAEQLVHKVAVCFYDNNEFLDRFVFDLLQLKLHRTDLLDTYLTHLQEELRAFCLVLPQSEISPLNENCSFQVQISTTREGSQRLACDPNFEDFSWIELQQLESPSSVRSITPVRTIKTETFTLQVYCESVLK